MYSQISASDSVESSAPCNSGAPENWAELLRHWLPSGYHVRTKRRVLTSQDKATSQVDIVVLSPSYPQGLLATNLYLAAGVVAAFECKNTLRLAHVREAVSRGVRLQQLVRSDPSVKHHIVFGLLAHSYAIRAKSPAGSVVNALMRADEGLVSDPRDCMDFLCVADLGSWALMRMMFVPPSGGPPFDVQSTYMGPSASMTGEYPVSPVGRLLTGLLRRLSGADPSLAAIASYFHDTGLFGMQRAHHAALPSTSFRPILKPSSGKRGLASQHADKYGVKTREERAARTE
jgi:hypothetical protein